MMNTLFRHIARMYVVNIAALMLIVGSLVVMVDMVINLTRFTQRAAHVAADSGGAAGWLHHVLLTGLLVIDLWGPRLLQLFTYLNGVVLIAAAGFTCVQLVRQREFVAMLSGGIGLRRAAGPFLAVGFVMILLQGLAQEVGVPAVAHLLARDASDAGKRRINAFPVRLSPDAEGRLWYARTFDDAAGVLEGLVVWERDAQHQMVRIIAADRATWDGRGWALEHGIARRPLDAESAAPPTPAEALARIDTTLDPARLKVRYLQGFASNLSWRDLASMIHTGGVDERTRERLDLVRWGRISGLFSAFIALCGALSLFLVKAPRPMLGPVLRASLVALGGFAASAAAASAPIPGLPIAVGAFVPCLALLSITVALYTGIET